MSDLATQFEALRQQLDEETTRIANYVEQLLALQQRTDLTAEQEEAVLAGFAAVAARLKAVGAADAPVPTEPLPELPA